MPVGQNNCSSVPLVTLDGAASRLGEFKRFWATRKNSGDCFGENNGSSDG